MPSLRASCATAAICGSASVCADARAGFALERLELGVGGDQSAGLVDPAEHGSRFGRCAGHGRSPARQALRDNQGRESARPERRRLRSSLIASKLAIARPASFNPTRSPMPARKPAASSRAVRPCGTTASAVSGSPDSNSSAAIVAGKAGAAGEGFRDKRRLRLHAPRRRSTRRRAAIFVEEPGKLGGERINAACRRRGAPERRCGAPARGRRPVAPRALASSSRRPRRSPGRARPRNRPADRRRRCRHWPNRSRRRPRARISAIAAADTAPFSWLTRACKMRASRRPLRALAAVAMCSSSARRRSKADQRGLVEQAAPKSVASTTSRLLSSLAAASRPAARRAARRRCRRPGSASIAVISARSCSVRRSRGSRKKSARTVDRRSRPARARGRVPVRWRSSDRPFFRHHSGRLIRFRVNFASTRGRDARNAERGRRRPPHR